MGISELSSLIKSRRSVRQWQEKPVPEELLLQAIELATWSPNAGNQQNWRFYAIINRQTIESIADAVNAISEEVYSWPEAEKFVLTGAVAPRKPVFFRNAPALIVVATSQYQSHMDLILEAHGQSDPRGNLIREWRNSACSKIQSVGGAMSLLCLILHQLGLGACWMTGPAQAKIAIEKMLKMPQGMDVVAVMPVGYPGEAPQSPGRKSVTDICEIIR